MSVTTRKSSAAAEEEFALSNLQTKVNKDVSMMGAEALVQQLHVGEVSPQVRAFFNEQLQAAEARWKRELAEVERKARMQTTLNEAQHVHVDEVAPLGILKVQVHVQAVQAAVEERTQVHTSKGTFGATQRDPTCTADVVGVRDGV
jgi:hypothetical protein